LGEIVCRLVQQQEVGLPEDRSREAYSRSLPAGELRQLRVQARFKSDVRERRRDAFFQCPVALGQFVDRRFAGFRATKDRKGISDAQSFI
jgi:hypothetical protein